MGFLYLSLVWAAPTGDVLHNLKMFASTQDLEFVQEQSRDVPDRELGPNIIILYKSAAWQYVICKYRVIVTLCWNSKVTGNYIN